MRRLALLAALAASAAALAACGGGGGEGPQPTTGGEPPAPEAETLGFADTLLVGDPFGYINGLPTRGQASCDGPVCTATVGGHTARLDISTLDPSRLSNLQILETFTRNGVQLTRVLVGAGRADIWGVWGEHSVGALGITHFREVARFSAFVVPVSVGTARGTNPVSGSASWTGMAVASELTPRNIGVRLGYDAELQLDFAGATLDLTLDPDFSKGPTSYQFHRVLAWRDVPVADGAFAARGLAGRSYGPNHEEAGGVFEDGLIAGAFTLKRQ